MPFQCTQGERAAVRDDALLKIAAVAPNPRECHPSRVFGLSGAAIVSEKRSDRRDRSFPPSCHAIKHRMLTQGPDPAILG